MAIQAAAADKVMARKLCSLFKSCLIFCYAKCLFSMLCNFINESF